MFIEIKIEVLWSSNDLKIGELFYGNSNITSYFLSKNTLINIIDHPNIITLFSTVLDCLSL